MLDFITNYWQVIIVAIIFIGAIIIKLKVMWNGNVIEWLVAVCAEMERELGSGTGRLKLAGAYEIFIHTFPIASKFMSAEFFAILVDEALDILDETIAQNDKIKSYIESK
jgi:hypothetical protein